MIQHKTNRQKIETYFPDIGPLRRELYAKHCEFFAAGGQYRERLMLAANRVGKTEGVGGYEMALHLTGEYPDWWSGRRFSRPIRAWASGDTSITVREIIQRKLFGPINQQGTGLIPGDAIERTTRKSGITDAIDAAFIKHKSGGPSYLVLKSYDQRRESFQGTEQDVIWLDEEPPLDIYTECLLRTMTNNGMLMLTFTPLLGLSDVVLQFLPGGKLEGRRSDPEANGQRPTANGGPPTTDDASRNSELETRNSRFVVMATWDDAPHLTPQAKAELWASIPPFQRDARSKGIPQLGSGAIYPVPESEIAVQPFTIPAYWPQGFGLDTDLGAGWTAAVWGAFDRDRQTLYITDCYKRSRAEIAVHVQAIKARGEWMPGVGDAAALVLTPHDAEQVISLYRRAGLDVVLPDKSVEAGLHFVWQMLSEGRLKVFKSCTAWFEEFRLYRRDEKGRVVKQNDHLMDATRYLCFSGIPRMKPNPNLHKKQHPPRRIFSPWS